jgi:predicted ATPase
MLMDLAYEKIAAAPKCRTHFAPFMLDVHQRLRAARETERGTRSSRLPSNSPAKSDFSPSTR